MVLLTRIYTRTGDKGETSLGGGERVSKSHIRIEAIGAVDELNSQLGITYLFMKSDEKDFIRQIQNELFDVGADLCYKDAPQLRETHRLSIDQSYVDRLEEKIDQLNAHLDPLRSFVLPGGSQASAFLHGARTICRRAERSCVLLSKENTVNPIIILYLNRLSDYLFVLARIENKNGFDDVLWVPGQTRG